VDNLSEDKLFLLIVFCSLFFHSFEKATVTYQYVSYSYEVRIIRMHLLSFVSYYIFLWSIFLDF